MAGEARHLTERTREIIGQMVHSIFVPLYFAGLALHLDFIANFDIVLVLFVTVVSIVAKFLGAWLGALGRDISSQDRVSIGIAFTPSGVTGIVVAGVALEYQIISTQIFVAIVCSAVASALLVAPWLSWSIRRRERVDLARILARKAILPALDAANRSAAIRELCHAAAPLTDLSVDEVTAAVEARERLQGTGIGHGIAVPHARIEALQRPLDRLRARCGWGGVGCPRRRAGQVRVPGPDPGTPGRPAASDPGRDRPHHKPRRRTAPHHRFRRRRPAPAPVGLPAPLTALPVVGRPFTLPPRMAIASTVGR